MSEKEKGKYVFIKNQTKTSATVEYICVDARALGLVNNNDGKIDITFESPYPNPAQ